jgi:MerR family transcriptional regulator, redox-sensitive transcriptional activator SoxR
MDPSRERLPIGDVAQASGRSASSIRYYERVGLIPAPERVSGQRRYPSAVLRTLAVIETAQRAGLTLAEIKALLAADAGHPCDPGDPKSPGPSDWLRQVATRKLPEVRALIERAERVHRWLEAAAGCACPTLDDCQLFGEPGRLPPPTRNPAPDT